MSHAITISDLNCMLTHQSKEGLFTMSSSQNEGHIRS